MTPTEPDERTAIKAIFHRIRTRALRDAKINLQHVNEAEEAVEALLAERIQTARAQGAIEERENMKFILDNGVVTNIPFNQYRYTGGGLLLNWDDRTKQLAAQLKAGEE